MIRKNSVKTRFISVMLVILLIVSGINLYVTADDIVMYEGDTLRGWQVDAYWSNGQKNISVVSDVSQQIDVKLTVSYYAPISSMTKALSPGTVSFSIPNIGSVRRSGAAFVPITAADQTDSDWNCTYNAETDSYIFTNKNTFEADKSFSGGFEMLWHLNTRECMNGYERIENPIFRIENEGTLMSPLSFGCTTERDYYRINLSRSYLSYLDYLDENINKNNYITYEYSTNFSRQLRARAGELNTYFVKVSFADSSVTDEEMSRIIVQTKNGGERSESFLKQIPDPDGSGNLVWGFYRFIDLESDNLSRDSFILSFPSELENKDPKIDTYLSVHYLDDPEGTYVTYLCTIPNEVLNAHNSEKVNKYAFTYGNGNFSMSKTSNYEVYDNPNDTLNEGNPPSYANRLLAKKIYNGEVVTFTVKGNYRVSYSTGSGASASTIKTTSSSAQSMNSSVQDVNIDDGAGVDLDTTFDFVLGDDRLSVITTSRDFRMLTADEYTIKRVSVQKDSFGYDYDVYVSNVGYDAYTKRVASIFEGRNDYTHFGSGNTSSDTLFDFTNVSGGVKAFYVVIHGVKADRNYSAVCKPDIAFHFNEGSSDVDTSSDQARITNVSFMRAFKTGDTTNICATSTDNFLFGFSSQIMYMDAASYNSTFIQDYANRDDSFNYNDYEMLYHAMSSVYLRDLTTALTSGTEVGSQTRPKSEGGGYIISIVSSGTINADKDTPGELAKFSVYTKIPPLVTIDKSLSGVTLSNCSGRDIFGNIVSNDAFADNVTFRLITLSNGDKVVASDFDFTDTPLEISELTSVKINIPGQIVYTDFKTTASKSFMINSYTMLRDTGIGRIVARNGETHDAYDFNGNGSTSEIMASSSAGKKYDNIVEEWEDTCEKFVKSYRDDTWRYEYDSTAREWRSETTVNAKSDLIGEEANKRSTYSYRLSIDMGSNSSDIIFSDIIENEPDSKWKGTLKSLDLSYATGLGLVPSVYYSTEELAFNDTNIGEFTAAAPYGRTSQWNGSTWVAPNENIRSIVVRLGTNKIPGGTVSKRELYFIMNMQAPTIDRVQGDETDERIGKYAVNRHSVYYTAHNSLSNMRIHLDSSTAKVKLLPAVLLVTIHKKDAQTGNVVSSAKFSFYTDEAGKSPVIDWQNSVTAQELEVNRLGELVVDTLEPGTYWYRETTAPAGYRLDRTAHPINLTGEDQILEIKNERLTGQIVFTKLDADDDSVTGLEGAQYALFDSNGVSVYTDNSNVYQATGGTKTVFTTDAEGKIIISGLPWGSYYLQEQTPPEGYEFAGGKVWANVSRNVNVDEQAEKNAIVVYCHQADEESTASIRLTKYDRDGVTPLQNAWFAVEKKNSEGGWNTVSTQYIKTGSNGIVTADGLKFGTYRFREVIAPTGYELDSENCFSPEVTLNAKTAGQLLRVTMTNERILGKASLRKFSDDDIPLNGAKFDLYMVNGEVDPKGKLNNGETVTYYDGAPDGDPADIAIKLNMATKTIDGQAGMLETITGLDWGRYYFKEFSSPSGYNKDDTIYYFEVTAKNAEVIFDSFKPVNDRRKGEVILSKVAGERIMVGEKQYSTGDAVQGAEFGLYTNAGEEVFVKAGTKKVTDPVSGDESNVNVFTVCKSTDEGRVRRMTTDENGQIRVDGIEWGGYYFEETKAPDGFALGDKVRFTVNSVSCLAVQELECEDKAMMCLIRIDKEIDTKRDVFGTPTFTFKIVNTDTEEDFTRMITLSGSSLSGSVTAQVPIGNYKVTEIPVNRYKLSRTEYILENNATTASNRKIDNEALDSKDGGKVFTFNLSTEDNKPQTAEVKFTNTLENYSRISHTDAINNIIPSRRKMTGFSLELKEEYEELIKENYILCSKNQNNSFTVTKDMLTGSINYDDGTSVDMTQSQLESVLPAQWTIDNGYQNAGQSFLLNAQYTDNILNKTFKTNFVATVGPYKVIESQKVVFRSDIENRCVFNVNGKQAGVNTVYYNDNEEGTAKVVVSGSYIDPQTITDTGIVQYWEIVGGEYSGERINTNSAAVGQFLAQHYDYGLRELTLRAVIVEDVFDFEQKNEVQEFVAPRDGIYFLEGWGAQGGNNGIEEFTEFTEEYLNIAGLRKDIQEHYGVGGGKGGYSYGYVYLKKDQKVYLAVGGKGDTAYNVNKEFIKIKVEGGWNGGSAAYATYNVPNSTARDFWGSGGGATHFALSLNGDGQLLNYSSSANQEQVLLVAGGGGGSGQYSYITNHDWNNYGKGGYGGGETGGSVTDTNWDNRTETYNNTGGSQTTGGTYESYTGKFGQGVTAKTNSVSGAGGGWYGGVSVNAMGGSGGSGHVNDTALITGATIGGNQSFVSPDGTMETGHSGDGHARITYISNGEYNLGYSGKVQQFTAPISGYYKLEGWGAQGGDSKKGKDTRYPSTLTQENKDQVLTNNEGGRGGYSYGYVYLSKGQKVYIGVGGKGETYTYEKDVDHDTLPDHIDGGYNGGGSAKRIDKNGFYYNGTGGGATHFALTLDDTGVLSQYASDQNNILLVAGGGGGSAYYLNTSGGKHVGSGGYGGGEVGGSNYDNDSNNGTVNNAYGGTQTAGGTGATSGSFGQGADGKSQWGSGGGGGWYGGGSSDLQGGGGGSGHVNDQKLITGATIGGNQSFVSPDGTMETGHSGDGFARITYIPYTEPIDYNYSGNVQTFTAPVAGYYKLEGWGAEGGTAVLPEDMSISAKGGKGGYSYGTVYLTAGQTIYIAVGGEGGISDKRNVYRQSGGFNGGGQSGTGAAGGSSVFSSGGGATHFALDLTGTGVLNAYSSSENQNKVLLVAGGGGGGAIPYLNNEPQVGGYGGGSEGGNGTGPTAAGIGIGGTQTSPGITGSHSDGQGAFGQGGNTASDGRGSGGGSGWYGGSFGYNEGGSAGGGSGHCNENQLLESYGYATIGGDQSFKAPDGTTENGHTGNGYARVSFVGAPDVLTYEYTGEVQTFTATKAGKYRFEAWGAQGGMSIGGSNPQNLNNSGKGAYTSGNIHLIENQTIYVYVGGKGEDAVLSGNNTNGGWNGGGLGTKYTSDRISSAGGGATDFRLVRSTASNDWSGFDSLKSRIMVAGAGGGCAWNSAWNYDSYESHDYGGSGGTLIGLNGMLGKGGSKDNTGGIFGKGEDGKGNGASQGVAGGGGGYYGGQIVTGYHHNGAGGGSSFISGHAGCNAIAADSTEGTIIHTNLPNHYSGMIFTNTQMIDGDSDMPAPDGSTEKGHTGNGYARITYLG